MRADAFVERGVLRRIDDVDAAGDHGAGSARERAFMRRRVDAARQAGGDDEPGCAKIGARAVPRICGPAPMRCARRRSRPFRVESSAACPRIEITGGGGSSAARPGGNSGSHDAIMRPPSASSRSSSRRASASEAGSKLVAATAPARRGNFASAAPAEPKRAISCAKVTGPTFCVRASLSQARRSRSLSARRSALSAVFFAPIRGSVAAQQTRDILAVHDEDEHREDDCEHVRTAARRTASYRAAPAPLRPAPRATRCARSPRPARQVAPMQQAPRARKARANTPSEGRDAFAALEAEPDRKQMAEERAEAGEQRAASP